MNNEPITKNNSDMGLVFRRSALDSPVTTTTTMSRGGNNNNNSGGGNSNPNIHYESCGDLTIVP